MSIFASVCQFEAERIAFDGEKDHLHLSISLQVNNLKGVKQTDPKALESQVCNRLWGALVTRLLLGPLWCSDFCTPEVT